jgi:hypothetical protein
MMLSLVLTHIHVYAIVTAAFKAVGEQQQLDTIRAYETGTPASHPSYVAACQPTTSRRDLKSTELPPAWIMR